MAGMYGVSAYQQTNRSWETNHTGVNRAASSSSGTDEYGNTIGNVQLSEKTADYLDKLKSKFHNMEFITVSKDMKAQVQQNAAAYGNANKMVVLIDDEKLERMATDESYRKKYEGIIAMSQSKMDAAKNSHASTGASVKNFGMSVDSNGKESFFATVEKSGDLQRRENKRSRTKRRLRRKRRKSAFRRQEKRKRKKLIRMMRIKKKSNP